MSATTEEPEDRIESRVSVVPVERLAVRRSDLEPVVLPRLTGSVFHVTSHRAWAQITATGVLHSNADARFPLTFPQSQNNYGRQQGWVCIFDLRDVPSETVREALSKFYFLKPTPANPVFLFLDPSRFDRLVPWTDAPVGAMVIPHVEGWYPEDLPVTAFSYALAVTVEDDDPDSAHRGIMRRLHRDKEDLLDSGRVGIEAETLEGLRLRAEEWVRVAREAGLRVDLAWDENRVVRTSGGYGIALHATRAEYWEALGGDSGSGC